MTHLYPISGHLYPISGHLYPISGHLSPFMGAFGRLWGAFGRLWGTFGRLWGAFGSYLGHIWACFSASKQGSAARTGCHGPQPSVKWSSVEAFRPRKPPFVSLDRTLTGVPWRQRSQPPCTTGNSGSLVPATACCGECRVGVWGRAGTALLHWTTTSLLV